VVGTTSVSVEFAPPLGLQEASNFVIERNPPFSSGANVTLPSTARSYSDTDFESQTTIDALLQSRSLRYRVKKAAALNWSPWTARVAVSETLTRAPTSAGIALSPWLEHSFAIIVLGVVVAVFV
jgi:hypothetical protein